jgi:hypothetical protein
LAAIKQAAPVEKPIMTVFDIKLTNVPSLARPITSCKIPTINASVIASEMYSGLPDRASVLNDENMTIDAAVMGPDTKCQEEPNSAAIMAGTMQVYRPYSGGKPAIVANATPCGKAIAAPVKPAIESALMVSGVRRRPQRKNGNILISRE